MLVIELLIFVMLSISDAISPQLLVSEAQVVKMVAHDSPIFILVWLVILELGFEIFVIAIILVNDA